MDGPDPKETKGVPWADHNETESSPEDTRREDYRDSDEIPDEKSADSGSSAKDLPTDQDRGDAEHEPR